MRSIVLAACAAALFAVSAAAQTDITTPPAQPAQPAAPPTPDSRCPAIPPEPALPDGATARNSREMQAGDTAYQTWGQAVQAVLECRRGEVEDLLPAARQHEARVREYNAAVRRLNEVGNAWLAEAAEFNARTQRR